MRLLWIIVLPRVFPFTNLRFCGIAGRVVVQEPVGQI